MNPNWAESHNSRITLQEPLQCCNVFGDFLAYLYTGDNLKLIYFKIKLECGKFLSPL